MSMKMFVAFQTGNKEMDIQWGNRDLSPNLNIYGWDQRFGISVVLYNLKHANINVIKVTKPWPREPVGLLVIPV